MRKFLKDENGGSELWAILSILISVIIVMFYLRVIKKHKETTNKITRKIDSIKEKFRGEN